METGFIILAIVGMVIGVVVGLVIGKVGQKPNRTQGVIYAYYDDDNNKPSLLLEYSVPIDDIASRKRVSFDVAVIRQDSRK